mmetsp:Transcript_51890/g.151087  ORF Transcript_51890/g.151087 Transcript_51890/m.151087 type:complete len:414 (+) Transcript_51890:832-2073(+)
MSGFAAEFMARAKSANPQAMFKISVAHCVASAPLPPPKSNLRAGADVAPSSSSSSASYSARNACSLRGTPPRCLAIAAFAASSPTSLRHKSLEPTFDGVTPAGIWPYQPLLRHAAEINVKEPPKAAVAVIMPVIAAEHSASTFGIIVWAHSSVAVAMLVDMLASPAINAAKLTAHTLEWVWFTFEFINWSKPTPSHVLETSLMFVATVAKEVVRPRMLITQAASDACSVTGFVFALTSFSNNPAFFAGVEAASSGPLSPASSLANFASSLRFSMLRSTAFFMSFSASFSAALGSPPNKALWMASLAAFASSMLVSPPGFLEAALPAPLAALSQLISKPGFSLTALRPMTSSGEACTNETMSVPTEGTQGARPRLTAKPHKAAIPRETPTRTRRRNLPALQAGATGGATKDANS